MTLAGVVLFGLLFYGGIWLLERIFGHREQTPAQFLEKWQRDFEKRQKKGR